MPRPFTRAQALQNRAFLEVLGRTGNARLAAREVGVRVSTMHTRRVKDAGLAQNWAAAVAAAHARFHLAGGKRGPEGAVRKERPGRAKRRMAAGGSGAPLDCARDERRGDEALAPLDFARDEPERDGRERDGRERDGRERDGARAEGPLHHRASPGGPDRRVDHARHGQGSSGGRSDPPIRPGEDLRTRGGEAMVVRTRSGRLQLRPAHPGKLTRAAEQAFLAALSASANVRLAAAAAGASARAFYRRRRQDKAFAREMRLALEMGYDRLEAAALQAALPESGEHDGWRRGEPPPVARMTAAQALQLLFLHERSVRQRWEQPHRRQRRGESDERYRMRLFLMWRAEQRQIAEERAVARAARYEASGDWRMADEPPPPALPPLERVTGWSQASGRPAHDPDLALFGGWRIGQMRARLRGGG